MIASSNLVDSDQLRESICKTFCGDLFVKDLTSSVAITTTFRDASSDPIACFIEKEGSGFYIVDDGHFLSDTIGRGIDVQSGSRKDFLDRILLPVGAWCDFASMEIRTETLDHVPGADDIIRFITALVRARDVTFWSRERVKSTFKDDAYRALLERFEARAELFRSAAINSEMQEFPADAILRPRRFSEASLPTTAIFFVQSLDTMNEALMLWMEAREQKRSDIRVAALLEDRTINLSSFKAQRALNRIDATVIFRGDEKAALDRIERVAIPLVA